jgi:hypothetical protein
MASTAAIAFARSRSRSAILYAYPYSRVIYATQSIVGRQKLEYQGLRCMCTDIGHIVVARTSSRVGGRQAALPRPSSHVHDQHNDNEGFG